MFGTIRKHQTWLWVIIIAVIIVSFVVFFSPYSRMNDSRGPANYGSINGQRIAEEEFISAWREVELRLFFMNGGRWPEKADQEELQAEAYKWLLLLQKQKQMGIQVGSEVAAQAGRAMLSQFLSGKLVTPQEARELYQREHQELATEAVFFSASNYLATVPTPPEAIGLFYTNRLAAYRVPERVQVSYVQFEFTNFLDQAKQELARMTNLDLQIDEAYRQGGSNFLRELNVASLEAARTKLRDLRLKELQAQLARKKGGEFAGPVFDMEPVRVENFEKAAKEQKLTVSVTAPFDREAGPSELEVGSDFVTRAFSRTPEDPFAGPFLGREAAYVIALNKKLPSEIPPLDQIRSRVVADYKEEQARSLARQAGMQFYQRLTNGLAAGKTVAAVCTEAKVDLLPLPPVSIGSRDLPALGDRVPLNQFKQLAFSTAPGKVSPFQPTLDGGIILHAKEMLPLDQARMEATLPSFMNYLRQSRQNEAFNEWFSKQASTGLRDTPLGQPKPPPTMTKGAETKKS